MKSITKQYSAIAVYSAELDNLVPQVAENQVFKDKEVALAFLRDSIARECEFGEENVLDEELYAELNGQLTKNGSCVKDTGDGTKWHWLITEVIVG